MHAFVIELFYQLDALKARSNAICCLKSTQYESIVEFLLPVFCPKTMKVCIQSCCSIIIIIQIQHMQLFSYTLDVLFPEGLHHILMDMYGLSKSEVNCTIS